MPPQNERAVLMTTDANWVKRPPVEEWLVEKEERNAAFMTSGSPAGRPRRAKGSVEPVTVAPIAGHGLMVRRRKA
jgi:hypothetical protein